MAPYADTKKNAQNSYSCTNDGSRCQFGPGISRFQMLECGVW